ncbi:MAG: metallophosphoesterase family protein [Fermentimonas sp.]
MFILREHPFKYFLFLLLVLISIQEPASSKEKNDTLKFVHLTDIHLILNPISYDSSFVQRRFNHFWRDTKPFIQFLKANPVIKRSDFLVITGDIIDFYEAESVEGGLMGNQIELFQKLINSETNSIVYLTLGNHDITSYPKGGYHQNHSIAARSTWIRNFSMFHNGTFYSKIYKVGSATYRLIFLDNAYFSANFYVKTQKGQADFIIDRPQLDWLKSQLSESPDDKEIIFMHMPLPVPTDQVEGKNNRYLDYDEYVNRTNTRDFLDVLKETDNASIQIIVAGHKHRNNLFDFNFSEDFSFKQIETGAFGNSIDNWRLFQLTESDINISMPDSSPQSVKIPLK